MFGVVCGGGVILIWLKVLIERLCLIFEIFSGIYMYGSSWCCVWEDCVGGNGVNFLSFIF